MSRRTLVLRVVLVALVALALADPRPWGGSRPDPALRVVDLSASMGPSGAEARAAADDGDAWLAVADGVRWVPAGVPVPTLPRRASALGAALFEAARTAPGRDVLLVSDGRATDDALAGARAVHAAGGRVFARVPAPPSADVGLLEARAQRAESTEVRVLVGGSVAGQVRLSLSREGRLVAEADAVVVAGGARAVRLVDPAPPDEPATYAVRLRPLAGTPNDDPGNDELAFGVRPERGGVLVWGDLAFERWTRPEADGPTVRRIEALTPGVLDTADVVVLADVPWWRIGPEGTALLAGFVAGGGRLLVLGGDEGYGPGGWGGTPFERSLLPLVVRTPAHGADWVLALDVSGSTRGEPLAALRDAARAALETLQPGERLAVLPFRGHAVPASLAPGFVHAGDAMAAQALDASLAALEAGGETDLVAGAEAALALLAAQEQGRERRLLLLTDGDPDDAPDVDGWKTLRPRFDAARVRFGAVVVDMVRLVDVLRLHVAPDPKYVVDLRAGTRLAPATLRELAWMRTAAERERLPAPDSIEASPGTWAALLPGGWRPGWLHDVESHAEGRVVARAHLSGVASFTAPFAAERTVGAGAVHALAWGPDSSMDPGEATRVLVPMVSRLLSEADRGMTADLLEDGRIEVRVPEATGAGSLSLVAKERVDSMLEVAPGLFRSEAPAPDEDGLRARGGPGVAAGLERVVRLPVRPPAEHRGTGPDRARLLAIAEAGGGRLLAEGEPVPVGPPTRGPSFAPWLLLAACILLVLDRARA